MREPRKSWKLELSNAELTILQIALQKFAASYEGDVFTKEELATTHEELFAYKYIPPTNQEI
jgi:hypothetical protein